jgi:alpha-tubulin suppressor-like RCC1 family protein
MVRLVAVAGAAAAAFALALTPVAVPRLKGALSISMGSQFACALVAGGGIACWGDDGTGQLGTGVAVPPGGDPHAATPVTVVSGS